jgi:DivIVA domain-containing protein
MLPAHLAAHVRTAAFPTRRFGRGYRLDQVDDVLDELAIALESAGADGPALARELLNVRLGTTMFVGYDERAVDAFIDDVAAQLQAAG